MLLLMDSREPYPGSWVIQYYNSTVNMVQVAAIGCMGVTNSGLGGIK
jgi:hypothetical protein